MQLLDALRAKFGPADGFTVLDYLYTYGSPVECLMYLELLWPRFEEIDGMVLLSELSSGDIDRDALTRVMQTEGGDRAAVERRFNHVEFLYIFGNPDPTGELDDDGYEDFGRVLCEVWKARLMTQFPGRYFVVELDLDDECIEMYEDRTSP